MQIIAFHPDYALEAAALFVQGYQAQRQVTPVLPDLMADSHRVAAMLARLCGSAAGVAAVDGGRLVGYMGWYLADNFRGTDRKGAYVPEWGHAAVDDDKPQIYRRMYRAAAERWAVAGCQVHAITLLAHDSTAEKVWYWNGFGLTVVDAIRPMRPLENLNQTALRICKATPEDVPALTELDAEHWAHYSRPPIFMPAHTGRDAAANLAFLARHKNSVWLAWAGDVLAGFLRFEGYDFDGVAVVESEQTIGITGAYVRPAYRGQRAAVALLDAGLRDYDAWGFTCCAVNFESFNPEAAAFLDAVFRTGLLFGFAGTGIVCLLAVGFR